jgi:hypothetical protein
MTKEHYFEMCEALGSTPVESEIPIGVEDLPEEVRTALMIWQSLPSDVDYFNGGYYGKHLHLYKPIFELYNVPVEDYTYYYNWIRTIDRLKTQQVQSKKSKPEKPLKASPT